MIKINLLGEEAAVDYTGWYILIGYVASVVALLLVFIFMYNSVTQSIEEMTVQTQNLETQLAKLKVTTKEVRDLEAKRAELQGKLVVIATLKRNKVGPVRVMDDLNKALPEKAWFTDVREKEGALMLTGLALDDQTIATFMRELERSDYFGTIDLVESKRIMVKNVRMSEFSIQAQVNYVGKIAPKPEGTPAAATEPSTTGGKA